MCLGSSSPVRNGTPPVYPFVVLPVLRPPHPFTPVLSNNTKDIFPCPFCSIRPNPTRLNSLRSPGTLYPWRGSTNHGPGLHYSRPPMNGFHTLSGYFLHQTPILPTNQRVLSTQVSTQDTEQILNRDSPRQGGPSRSGIL